MNLCSPALEVVGDEVKFVEERLKVANIAKNAVFAHVVILESFYQAEFMSDHRNFFCKRTAQSRSREFANALSSSPKSGFFDFGMRPDP